jgi:hypothetical protein
MTDKPQGRRSLRRVVPLAVAGCGALAATVLAGRRRSGGRGKLEQDPPDSELAADEMEALATGEGMPEARED